LIHLYWFGLKMNGMVSMTKDEIIEMAKKCGWDNPANNMMPLYEFAKLVAQHEREAIAKMVEPWLLPEYVEKIRARGNTQ